MRLVNALTYKLEEFQADKIPPYAILSHTWGEEEVTYHQLLKFHNDRSSLSHIKGWKKIEYCCSQALEDGLSYIWADTCCIEKSSSAELSEAINSMYQWYLNSTACYAYLEDLDIPEEADSGVIRLLLPTSRWFTRGWTLQELLAPSNVIFYDSKWTRLGTKNYLNLPITKITGIDYATLAGELPLSETSVARRMSWAANRVTTRVEDIAYCLLGIFGVYMPLIYGEGHKAFIRLQEEIIKENDDQSIFAWEYDESLPYITKPDESFFMTIGILAPHPQYFAQCGSVVNSADREHWDSYSMTNRGLRMQLPILRLGPDRFAGILNCAHNSKDELWGSILSYIALPLRPSTKGDNSLGRSPNETLLVIREAEIQNAQVYWVYLLKSSHIVSADGLRYNIINCPPIENHKGFYIYRGIYAAKPISNLSTFHSFDNQISSRTLQLPPIASDFVVALQFRGTQVHLSASGFTVVLESRRACQSWGVTAVASRMEDALEQAIQQNVGRLPSFYKGYVQPNLRAEISVSISPTQKLELDKIEVELDLVLKNHSQPPFFPDQSGNQPNVLSIELDAGIGSTTDSVSPIRTPTITVAPVVEEMSRVQLDDKGVNVIEGTFELE